MKHGDVEERGGEVDAGAHRVPGAVKVVVSGTLGNMTEAWVVRSVADIIPPMALLLPAPSGLSRAKFTGDFPSRGRGSGTKRRGYRTDRTNWAEGKEGKGSPR